MVAAAVHSQDSAKPGDLTLGVFQARFLHQSNHGSQRIEHVDEEHREDDVEDAQGEGGINFQGEESIERTAPGIGCATGQAERDADERGTDNADRDPGPHAARQERGGE